MSRLALSLGARAETLAGLSGLGDLVLTCTSPQSRNFRFGLSLGEGTPSDPRVTIEGTATARAALTRATALGIEMPVTAAVVALLDGRASLSDAITMLLSRPPKEE
jgi:glycerol-3-phosphate dehydrogenase (NAD(P)+)